MAKKVVYVVGAHDESWGFHGDYNIAAFEDEALADKFKEHLEANLCLLKGDQVYVEKMTIRDSMPMTEEDISGFDICRLMHSMAYAEEES